MPFASGPIASARVVSSVTRRIDGRGPAPSVVSEEDDAPRPQAARSRIAAHAVAHGRHRVNVRRRGGISLRRFSCCRAAGRERRAPPDEASAVVAFFAGHGGAVRGRTHARSIVSRMLPFDQLGAALRARSLGAAGMVPQLSNLRWRRPEHSLERMDEVTQAPQADRVAGLS